MKLKQALPTILCVASIFGTIGAVISAVKATPKAVEKIKEDSRKAHDGDPEAYTKKEAVASAWKYYIPTAGFVVGTAICVFSSNSLNKKQQTALIGACELARQQFGEYRSAAKKVYGEDADRKITSRINAEQAVTVHVDDDPQYQTFGTSFDDCDDPTHLFYVALDPENGRYFEATIAHVLEAEKMFERNFAMGKAQSLNDFYEFLGISPIIDGQKIGWSGCSEDFFMIDFFHEKITLDDGLECYFLCSAYVPDERYLEYY